MSKRIVVDPITRIEGHLRVEADIENGKIKDAYSSGTMVRLLLAVYVAYAHQRTRSILSARLRMRSIL